MSNQLKNNFVCYSSIMLFYQIWSRESENLRLRYTVVSRFDRFTAERIRTSPEWLPYTSRGVTRPSDVVRPVNMLV